MNMRPWNIDDLVRMEQANIQKQMRRIRLLKAGEYFQAPRQSRAAQIFKPLLLAAKGWLQGAQKPAQSLEPWPHVRRD